MRVCPAYSIHENGELEWSEAYALAREHPGAMPMPF